MASLTSERARWGRAALVLALAIVSAWAASPGRAETRYVCQTRYTAFSPLAARFRHVTLMLGDGNTGVFGGFGRMDAELFDPVTEQFLTLPVSYWLADFSGVTLADGRALLVDGEHDIVFDFATRKFVNPQNTYTGGFIRWPVLLPLPDGRIFICGGCDIDFLPMDACGFFDPQTLLFAPAGRLLMPRYCPGAVLLDDYQVLINGGRDVNEVVLDSLELFDVRTGQSAVVPTRLRQARAEHGCVRLADNRVLLVGGNGSSNNYSMRSTEIFDPNTGTTVEGPNLALGRSGMLLSSLPSGRIAVLGGRSDVRAVEIYCPRENVFVPADALLLDPRESGFTATALAGGAVLVLGGRVNSGAEVIQTAEIFEEVTRDVNAPAPADERAEKWCVEYWDGDIRQSTVWLDGYACPEYRDTAFPYPHFTAILGGSEEVAFTHLVVRFSRHAPYETRIRLFNLVGWTRIPQVILGDDLDATTRVPEG